MLSNKLFITGGSGFVGSHILKQLVDEGFDCKALYRNVPFSISGPEWIKGDLLDPAGYEMHLNKIDTIVHAAGATSYRRIDKDKLLSSNYLTTKELVNLALHKGVQNLIYISSASTLIRSGNPLHISINGKGNQVFNSFYSKTKFLAELEIWRAAAEGMNVCILHPSLVIGNWNWKRSSMQIFEKVKSGISHYPPGNLGIVAAEDLARIVSHISKFGISENQILVNAEVWTYKDFLNEIASNLNLTEIRHEATKWIAQVLSIYDSMQFLWKGNAALITKETIKSSFSKFSYQQTSLEKTMNFKYQDIRKLIQKIVWNQSS